VSKGYLVAVHDPSTGKI